MVHIDVLRDEMDAVRSKLGSAQERIAELEGEKAQQKRREQNLVLQACLHCRNHEGALVDCTRPECSEARAALAPEGE